MSDGSKGEESLVLTVTSRSDRPDADSYQPLLDRLDRAETVAAIWQGNEAGCARGRHTPHTAVRSWSVLAKHSGHFSLVDAISWFEVAMRAVHALARQIGEGHQINDEIVKPLIYPAFT